MEKYHGFDQQFY